MNAYDAITSAMVAYGKRSLAQRQLADASRPIGFEALQLGISDYRKQPERSINSEDWAVWRVRWNGSEWQRHKRLAAWKSYDEALKTITRLCGELNLTRAD